MPYFIDELIVSDIVLGEKMPLVQRASSPYVDERGFWLDFDVAYNGGFRMTIETRVNLMKLKKCQGEMTRSNTSIDNRRRVSCLSK